VSTLPSDYDVAEENRRARQLRMIVDLASSVIVQGGLGRKEAEALVAATRRRALELFPGKEDTFDLILADASASTLDHVDAIVDASRSGGMLIFDHKAVSAAATEPDTSLTTLRHTVLDHDKLIAVDIDWASGLLVATKRP